MFNETLAKLKEKADQTIQKLKAYKMQEDFVSLLERKRSTLRLELPEFSLQTKLHQPKAKILETLTAMEALWPTEKISQVLSTVQVKNFSKRRAAKYALAFTAVSFLAYEYFPTRTRIALTYDKNSENADIVSKLTYLHNKHYYPTFFLFSALLQSIYNINTRVPSVNFHRESIKLPDGGTICIDWANPRVEMPIKNNPYHHKYVEVTPTEDTPTIFVIHGLTGGSEEGYVRGLVKHAQKRGFRVAVFQHRGVNQMLSTPMPYHGGKLDDIVTAVEHVRNKFPKAKLYAVGNSLGGNQLLRYLAMTGKNCPFESAVTLSSPFDVNGCLKALEGSVYEKFFVKRYAKEAILPHVSILMDLSRTHDVNLDHVLSSRSLRDFHEKFTVKVFNAKGTHELFDTLLVTKEMIQKIQIPTLLLHSKDDPIVTAKHLPRQDIASNPNLILAETARGAHICWFSGLKPKRVN